MPAPTTMYPFRPLLTQSEIHAVYRYMTRVFEKTGYHISLQQALERLLRTAIETERGHTDEQSV